MQNNKLSKEFQSSYFPQFPYEIVYEMQKLLAIYNQQISVNIP